MTQLQLLSERIKSEMYSTPGDTLARYNTVCSLLLQLIDAIESDIESNKRHLL